MIQVEISLQIDGEPTPREAAILSALSGGTPSEVQVKPKPEKEAEPKPSEKEAEPKPSEPEKEAEPKPKRKRRTKAQIEADEAAAKATREPEAEPEAEPEGATPAELRSKAQTAAIQLMNREGREALVEVLRNFGAEKLARVRDEDLSSFIQAIEDK